MACFFEWQFSAHISVLQYLLALAFTFPFSRKSSNPAIKTFWNPRKLLEGSFLLNESFWTFFNRKCYVISLHWDVLPFHGVNFWFQGVMMDSAFVFNHNLEKKLVTFLLILQTDAHSYNVIIRSELPKAPPSWHFLIVQHMDHLMCSSRVDTLLCSNVMIHDSCHLLAWIMTSIHVMFSSPWMSMAVQMAVCFSHTDAHHWIAGTIITSFDLLLHLDHTSPPAAYGLWCYMCHMPIHNRQLLALHPHLQHICSSYFVQYWRWEHS